MTEETGALPYAKTSFARSLATPACWLAVFCYMLYPLVLGGFAPAYAASSASFQVRDDQIGGNQFTQTSGSFQVHGGVEAIVGSVTSPTFQSQVGTPLQPGTTATTPSDGGGGLSTGPDNCAAASVQLTNVRCSRAYKSLLQLTGSRNAATPFIFVNESMSGVFLSSLTSWSNDVYLVQGENTITIYGKNACDAKSPPIVVVITKAKMGDTNDDLATDDYDLSTFTRRWESRLDCISDFNQDAVTNDYDLSLLASAWTG